MVKSTPRAKNSKSEKNSSFFLWAQNLLQELNERSGEIIKKRFGIFNGEPETLEKIGQDYQITRERVRQIIVDSNKKILKKKDNVALENKRRAKPTAKKTTKKAVKKKP